MDAVLALPFLSPSPVTWCYREPNQDLSLLQHGPETDVSEGALLGDQDRFPPDVSV